MNKNPEFKIHKLEKLFQSILSQKKFQAFKSELIEILSNNFITSKIWNQDIIDELIHNLRKIGKIKLIDVNIIQEKLQTNKIKDQEDLSDRLFALEVINKLLKGFKYVYIGTSGMFLGLKNFNTLPQDVDISASPLVSLYDSYQLFKANLLEIKDNFGPNTIPIIKITNIQTGFYFKIKPGDDLNDQEYGKLEEMFQQGNLKITFNIKRDIKRKGKEIELFPEKDWLGLTNLEYAKNKVYRQEIQAISSNNKFYTYSLHPKIIAKKYVINLLNEINKHNYSTKKRIIKIILNLQECKAINKTSDLINFIDQTIAEFEKYPQQSSYVKNGINNAQKVKNILQIAITNFENKINMFGKNNWQEKLENGQLKDLPKYKLFINKISKYKQELVRHYKEFNHIHKKLEKHDLHILIKRLDEKYKQLKLIIRNIIAEMDIIKKKMRLYGYDFFYSIEIDDLQKLIDKIELDLERKSDKINNLYLYLSITLPEKDKKIRLIAGKETWLNIQQNIEITNLPYLIQKNIPNITLIYDLWEQITTKFGLSGSVNYLKINDILLLRFKKLKLSHIKAQKRQNINLESLQEQYLARSFDFRDYLIENNNQLLDYLNINCSEQNAEAKKLLINSIFKEFMNTCIEKI